MLTRIKDAEFDIIYVAREEIDKRDFIDAVKELDIALIATYGPAFPTSISDLLKHLNSQPKTAVFAGNVFPESNIELRSRKIDFKKNSLETIKGFVIGNHSNETGIVYCLSNKKVDQVRSLLKKARIPAERYGGENSSKNEKEQALKSFNNDAQQCILVSNLTLPTKKITRKDVRFAVHIDPPRSLEEYRDQISFLGLDGLPATSIIIWDDYDFQKYHDMLEKSKISKGTRLEKSTLLMNMRDYCNTPDCLRCYLLDYFSKDHSKNVEPCGICTNCKNNRNRRNW